MIEYMQHVEVTLTLLQREKFTQKKEPTLSVTGKASEHQLPFGTSRDSVETRACLMPLALQNLKEELAKRNIALDLSTKAEADALREELKTVTESRDHSVASNARLRKELDAVAKRGDEYLGKLNRIFDSLPPGEYRSAAKSTPEAVFSHLAELNQRLENQRRLLNARDEQLDGLRKQVTGLIEQLDDVRNLVPAEYRDPVLTTKQLVQDYIRRLKAAPEAAATLQLQSIRRLVPPSFVRINESTLACVQGYIGPLTLERHVLLRQKSDLLEQRNRIAARLGVPVGTDLSDEKTWVPEGAAENLTAQRSVIEVQREDIASQRRLLDTRDAELAELCAQLRERRAGTTTEELVHLREMNLTQAATIERLQTECDQLQTALNKVRDLRASELAAVRAALPADWASGLERLPSAVARFVTWAKGTAQAHQKLAEDYERVTRDNNGLSHDVGVTGAANFKLNVENEKLRQQLNNLLKFVPEGRRHDDACGSVRSYIIDLHFEVSAKDAQLKDAHAYVEKLTAERDNLRTAQNATFDALQREFGKGIVKKVEDGLLYPRGSDVGIREQLIKAEAKVQKLTERLAKCGMARVDLEKQLAEVRERGDTSEMRRMRRALAIVMTHFDAQRQKYSSLTDHRGHRNTLSVGVVTCGPQLRGPVTEHRVLFDVMGYTEDGLVTGALREVTG